MHHFWIILTGILVAIPCAMLGSYLILRKMSMVSDAISHAVLPGIVIAFLLTGSRTSVWLLLGAGTMGILATFLIEAFHKWAKIQTDAAIGVIFTSLFALGVILATAFAGNTDLDEQCILYGEILFTPYDKLFIAQGLSLGPKSVWIMGIITILVIVMVMVGWKEFFVTTFDPAFAAAIGISTTLWHYLLMSAVSFTTVAAFDSVGAILVIAFLIAPAATAYLLTNNIRIMLLLAVLFGISASILGYLLGVILDSQISGAMATVMGIQFVIVLIVSPSHGLLRKYFRRRRRTENTVA